MIQERSRASFTFEVDVKFQEEDRWQPANRPPRAGSQNMDVGQIAIAQSNFNNLWAEQEHDESQ